MTETTQGVHFSHWATVYFPLSGVSWPRVPRPMIKPCIMAIATRPMVITGPPENTLVCRISVGCRGCFITTRAVLWTGTSLYTVWLSLFGGEISCNCCTSWSGVSDQTVTFLLSQSATLKADDGFEAFVEAVVILNAFNVLFGYFWVFVITWAH